MAPPLGAHTKGNEMTNKYTAVYDTTALGGRRWTIEAPDGTPLTMPRVAEMLNERADMLAALEAIEATMRSTNADGSPRTIGHGIDANSPHGLVLAAIAKARGQA